MPDETACWRCGRASQTPEDLRHFVHDANLAYNQRPVLSIRSVLYVQCGKKQSHTLRMSIVNR